jgi:hypothetical protein
MAYQLGDDPEMDEIVWGIRKFVPGFFPGCQMKIMSVSGNFTRRTDVIGEDLVAGTNKGTLEAVLKDLKAGGQTIFDAKNKHRVNLSSTDVMVISDQESSFVKLDQTIKRLKDFIPGYEFGCMLEVVKVPDVHGTCKVGDKFKSTNLIDRLYQFVNAMIDDDASSGIDPKNTYGANYERDSLAAVGHTQSYKEPLKETSYDKFSQGYRIKTIPEMEKEYGSLSDVPGYFNPMAMVHLAGVPVTNQFADSVIEHGRFRSDDNDFKNPSLTKDNSWQITKEMLTNKPPLDLVFGKFTPGDIVVSLTTLGESIRKKGDMFKVGDKSTATKLYYDNTYSDKSREWRLATKEEQEDFHRGAKNISDFVDKTPSFSLGYRIKTVEEMTNEYGDPGCVPGNFIHAMVHMAGLPISDGFAKKLINDPSHNHTPELSDFENPDLEKDYKWGISIHMITQRPIKEHVPPVSFVDADFGIIQQGINAPSVLATPVKKKEIEFVSDFTTAQLKPKSKRQKLSIN